MSGSGGKFGIGWRKMVEVLKKTYDGQKIGHWKTYGAQKVRDFKPKPLVKDYVLYSSAIATPYFGYSVYKTNQENEKNRLEDERKRLEVEKDRIVAEENARKISDIWRVTAEFAGQGRTLLLEGQAKELEARLEMVKELEAQVAALKHQAPPGPSTLPPEKSVTELEAHSVGLEPPAPLVLSGLPAAPLTPLSTPALALPAPAGLQATPALQPALLPPPLLPPLATPAPEKKGESGHGLTSGVVPYAVAIAVAYLVLRGKD